MFILYSFVIDFLRIPSSGALAASAVTASHWKPNQNIIFGVPQQTLPLIPCLNLNYNKY